MGNSEIKRSIWDAITANDPESLLEILKQHPTYLNSPISDDNKTNAATRAAYLDRPHILAALFTLGADLNKPADSGISPLMWASAKNHLESVKFLINFGADLNQTGPHGMEAIDFAVLYGAYSSAFFLHSLGAKPTKTIEGYLKVKEVIATPYIDLGGFLMSLEKQIPPDVVPFFTLAPIKRDPTFVDPVRDPNETWGHWFNRMMEFERPPLVERASLQVECKTGQVKNLEDVILNDVTVDQGQRKSSGPEENKIDYYKINLE